MYLGNSTFWILLSLCLLSVIVIFPLMSPLRQITPTQFLDYTDIDGFYHSSRVQLFGIQAPLITSPDLSGIKSLVYPDLNHFWIGQVATWTSGGPRKGYLIYAPALLVIGTIIVSYATGKALTCSVWGGYLASALAYIILIPNPYDSTFFLRDFLEPIVNWNAERMHFLDFRFGLAYGVGWLLLSGVVLALALYTEHTSTRTGIGLLSVAAFLIGPLLRIRPHYSIIVIPVFGLILVYMLVKERKWQYLLPFFVLGIVTTALFLESTGGNYELATSELGIEYGLFANFVAELVPSVVRQGIALLPPLLQPPLLILALFALRVVGLAMSLIIGVWGIILLRKRQLPSLPILFMFGVLLVTWLAVLFIILEPYRNIGGDWGGQALFILPRIAMLIAVVPLYQWGRAAVERFAVLKQNAPALALIGLTFGAGISQWGAESTLKSEPLRAYQISADELDAYGWIAANTPQTASIAADTRHRVNAQGETIGDTNFLSGMTERPGYLQRIFINGTLFAAESKHRQDVLDELFAAASPARVQTLLKTAAFDYLLVYQDLSPHTDLACCMLELRSTYPRIYQNQH